MAIACSQQDFFLVTEDYYQQELMYQQRIDAIKNVNRLNQPPQLTIDAATACLKLRMPEGHQNVAGVFRLYSPVNPAFDQEYPLPLPDCLSLDRIQSGRWEVQIDWKKAGEAFYHAESLSL